MIRFHFEDSGQDCLWWDVDETEDLGAAVIIDANLQAGLWADGKHYVNMAEPHAVGDKLIFTNDLPLSIRTGYSLTFKHKVVAVERGDDASAKPQGRTAVADRSAPRLERSGESRDSVRTEQ